MSEPSFSDDRFRRAVDDLRLRAVRRLDALAGEALGKSFSAGAAPGTAAFVTELARRVARDLTAIGLSVADHTHAAVPGGVWLAPAPDLPGVIVSWTQHDASATAFGLRMHGELQRQLNLILFEVLHTLGYAVERYGPGGAHIITRFRAPLDGYDTSPA